MKNDLNIFIVFALILPPKLNLSIGSTETGAGEAFVLVFEVLGLATALTVLCSTFIVLAFSDVEFVILEFSFISFTFFSASLLSSSTFSLFSIVEHILIFFPTPLTIFSTVFIKESYLEMLSI